MALTKAQCKAAQRAYSVPPGFCKDCSQQQAELGSTRCKPCKAQNTIRTAQAEDESQMREPTWIPPVGVDLAPYSKHIAYLEAIEHAPTDDYAILANEGCLLTNAEFDQREKAGTLPDDFL
jgi:hypothetical protein